MQANILGGSAYTEGALLTSKKGLTSNVEIYFLLGTNVIVGNCWGDQISKQSGCCRELGCEEAESGRQLDHCCECERHCKMAA